MPRRACTAVIALAAGLSAAQTVQAEDRNAECTPQRFEKSNARLCAPPPPPYASNAIMGYDPDRGAYIRTRDGRYELNPYGMVQLQNVEAWKSGKLTESTFSLHSAKLIFHGHVLDPKLTYHFQLNAGQGKVVAEDVYLRWDPDPALGLFVGQIEVPYNRQHITLEAYQELIDRSVVDARFTLQRDLGMAAYVSDRAHTIEWTSGLWNGARQDAPNDDTSYQVSTRLAWNPFGPIAFREADLDDSPKPRVSIATAGVYNPKRVVTDSAGKNVITRHVAQEVVEATLRFRGLSVTTEGHARRLHDESGRLRTDYGTFLQVGEFVVPRRVELVARAAEIAGDLSPQDIQRETTVGVSFYLHAHRFKVQADASRLETFSGTASGRARAQLQFFF